MTTLERTVERIGRIATLTLNDCKYFTELVHSAANIKGVEAVFHRIIERDDEQAIDHLAEIKYGALFRALRFLVQFEPTGTKGPDLLVTRDQVAAFVEVKRYRSKEVDSIPESGGPGGTLAPYGGDLARTQARMEEDLLCKIRQIEPRNGVQHGILAIWSDRDSVEDDIFQCAVKRVSSQGKQKSLRFCLFGSIFVTVGGVPQRFFCEPVSLPAMPFRNWMEDIQSYLA